MIIPSITTLYEQEGSGVRLTLGYGLLVVHLGESFYLPKREDSPEGRFKLVQSIDQMIEGLQQARTRLKGTEIWTAVYWREGVKHTETYDTLTQVLRFLEWGEENSAFIPEGIIYPDGTHRAWED